MIEGDLLEEFQDDIEALGLARARRRFAWNVIKFIRPEIVGRRSSHHVNFHNMFPHYLVSAFRQLSRKKVLSFINITGLAVGLCTYFLISKYVSFELSYDNFHKNKEQIFRVAYLQQEQGEVKIASAKNFIGVPALARQHLPEVMDATAFDRSSQSAYFQFVYEGKNHYQPGSFYQTDENFFKVFPSLLLKGDASSVLSDPHNLVLSQRMATLIFGDEDPIGKKIDNRSYSYSDVGSFVVTGVMIDIPENAHFHINFIAKNSNDEESAPGNFWTEPRFYTYLTLAAGADPAVVEDKLNALLKGLNKEHPNTAGVRLNLQSVTDIHHSSDLAEELEPNGNKLLLYVLSVIGIAVLVCAWINYVNIETGRFIERAKEIDVRRILGSGNGSLARQFFTEYLVNTTFSILIAVVTLFSFAPFFNDLSGLHYVDYWYSPVWIGACTLFAAGVLITGILLTTVFTRRRPSLPGSSGGIRSTRFRKVLIAFQFTCSISLIAILMVVHTQTEFLMSTNKNMDVENIISIRNPTVYTNEDSLNLVEYATFQHDLTSSTMVNSTTGSSAIPGMEIEVSFINRLKRNSGDPYDPTTYKILFIDYDYIPFYDLKLKVGRNYSVDSGDDNNWSTIILNETAVRALGFPGALEAVDKEVYFRLFGEELTKFKIVGVVEDYHHETAKNEIQPTILSLNHRFFQQVFYSVKLNRGTNAQDGHRLIEKTWKKLFPDKPFDYFFQNEYYDRQFKTERRFGAVFGLFSGISMLIACLGIIGMTVFETNSRAKEVSIKKVLGATVANLVALLSIGYLRLVILSSIICIPIIYLFSLYWLNHYPIRIPITVWFFVAPVVTLIIFVAISSAVQTFKAAVANPVDQLNHE
jgi:putative ABC transport system permease protein